MGKLKPGTAIIYESPDGGETVYGRYSGEPERWMVGQSLQAQCIVDDMLEDKLWGDIRRAAKTDAGLQDLLDCAIMYYTLKTENNSGR